MMIQNNCITFIHEEKRMGTAGALSLMKEKLTDNYFYPVESFIKIPVLYKIIFM